jgi:hypothetical protein
MDCLSIRNYGNYGDRNYGDSALNSAANYGDSLLNALNSAAAFAIRG